MSSVQHLREFIRERLTAAAEEIFSEVEKTIVRYEEEIKLLEICWKPQIKLTRIDLKKPHVSNLKEASATQQLCNQERSSSHDQEEAEPQCTEDEQMEPDSPLVIGQRETGPPWIKEEEEDPELKLLEEENEEPGYSGAKEEHIEPEPPLIEDQEEPEPPLLEQQEESECPLMVEENEEPDSLVLKSEQQVPEPLPTRHDQKDLHSSQEGEQLVQEQSIALMETSTLQEGDLSEEEPRTEQLSFHVSPVVETKDQEGGGSTVSESQSHTDTKKMCLNCDVCGRPCKSKYLLKLHYRLHTGERPFSCQTCGKRFLRPYSLTVHQRTHTSGRTFSCPTCGESFSEIGNLNVHKKVHRSERTFSCKTCGEGFSRRDELFIHQRTHLVVGPVSCEICGKDYADAEDLNFHVGQKHKVVIDWSQPWV